MMLIFLRLLSYLPLWLLYILFSPLVYIVLRWPLRYRKATITKNLQRSFPELSSREIAKLRERNYRFLSTLVPEVIKSLTISRKALLNRMHLINPEILEPLKSSQQSAIFLTQHHANWEWLSPVLGAHLGVPVDALYRPLHNVLANNIMLASRSRFGSQPIADKVAPKTMMRRRKEFRAYGLVADQRPSPWGDQYWTTFLNQKTSFFVGPDRLARLLKYPVFILSGRRVALGRYEVEIIPLASPPYNDEQESIIEAYARQAENAIRRQPETYLWSHNKWRDE